PQSGLMQSTRTGDLDPFAVMDMLDREQMTTDEMRTVLCKQSGLKGLSSIDSGDMRDILDAQKEGNERAALAVDTYVYDIKKYIGAYAAAMNGLDVIVFTGGIGERSVEIRARVCEGLTFLGITLDPARNKRKESEMIISSDEAKTLAAVIIANEERIIVREVVNVIEKMT
ncbi:MAG: acetate kinase, partial [Candidatus Latescibacteria bacterium]|nr:acetate kinase [Candidatus Latescibacterota bacterium]